MSAVWTHFTRTLTPSVDRWVLSFSPLPTPRRRYRSRLGRGGGTGTTDERFIFRRAGEPISGFYLPTTSVAEDDLPVREAYRGAVSATATIDDTTLDANGITIDGWRGAPAWDMKDLGAGSCRAGVVSQSALLLYEWNRLALYMKRDGWTLPLDGTLATALADYVDPAPTHLHLSSPRRYRYSQGIEGELSVIGSYPSYGVITAAPPTHPGAVLVTTPHEYERRYGGQSRGAPLWQRGDDRLQLLGGGAASAGWPPFGGGLVRNVGLLQYVRLRDGQPLVSATAQTYHMRSYLSNYITSRFHLAYGLRDIQAKWTGFIPDDTSLGEPPPTYTIHARLVLVLYRGGEDYAAATKVTLYDAPMTLSTGYGGAGTSGPYWAEANVSAPATDLTGYSWAEIRPEVYHSDGSLTHGGVPGSFSDTAHAWCKLPPMTSWTAIQPDPESGSDLYVPGVLIEV